MIFPFYPRCASYGKPKQHPEDRNPPRCFLQTLRQLNQLCSLILSLSKDMFLPTHLKVKLLLNLSNVVALITRFS